MMCVVIAALVQVLGADAAEVPVVATRPGARHEGLARCLLTALEDALKKIGVARIAMPAIRAAGRLSMLDRLASSGLAGPMSKQDGLHKEKGC